MSLLGLLSVGAGTPIEPDPVAEYRQVASRSGVSTYPMSTVSDIRTKTDRVRVAVAVEGTDPRISFNNVQGQGAGLNAITYAAAIEVGGVIHPFLFLGSENIILAPGESITSDPLTGITVPAGDVHLRIYTEIPLSTDKFAQSWGVYLLSANGEGTNRTTTGANLTLTGSGAVPGSNTAGMPALGLSAMVETATAPDALALVGDSITEAQTDDYQVDPTHSGYGVRGAVAAGVPYINYARGGDKATLMTEARRAYWFEAVETCTRALCAYAINDLAGARTLAQLQADNISLWTYLNGQGLTVRQTTCTPYTTSTDSFATTANQTAVMVNGETNRLNWNAWLRDGAPILDGAAALTGSSAAGTLRAGDTGHPLDGIVDTAATVETSGKWDAGTTGDGLHPNPTGHGLMAAPVTAWLNS
jgi:hypothetical protein